MPDMQTKRGYVILMGYFFSFQDTRPGGDTVMQPVSTASAEDCTCGCVGTWGVNSLMPAYSHMPEFYLLNQINVAKTHLLS